METLKKIAKRNVEKLIAGGQSEFDLFNTFVRTYDKVSKTKGTDHLLFEFMINELGYEKSQCGGWIKI